ncbi:MAG: hypothetical protein ABI439_04085, partial [Rhodospirillales bacterium]
MADKITGQATSKTAGDKPAGVTVLGTERPIDATHEGQKHPFRRPRDAATLIIVRQGKRAPEILLGCRDATHAFMPNRYVFPGGRVDLADGYVPLAGKLRPDVEHRLLHAATPA